MLNYMYIIIYIIEYYLTIKRNEVLITAVIWLNFKNIMLSERSQTQKVTYASSMKSL